MNVTTQGGVRTSLKWWDQMHVEDEALILTRLPKDDEGIEQVTLVIAEFPGRLVDVQALHDEINFGIRAKRPSFDVNNWSEQNVV